MGSGRYLAAELLSEGELERDGFVEEMNREARRLLGDAGAAAVNLWLYDFDGDSCVVGCRDGEVERARAVLACLDEVGGVRTAVHVKVASGTLRGARSRG